MTLLFESDSPVRCSYNGLIFFTYSSKASGRPVLDSAGRAPKFVEYEFEITAHVSAEGGETTTDSALEDMRTRLTQTGGRLKYVNKGFGGPETLDVNGPGGIRDACYGPKPELLSFVPVGDSVSALVTWRVKTWLPCQHAEVKKYRDLIVEFTYRCQHSLDQDGYSKIQYNGTCEIAANRVVPGSVALSDHVDRVREQVKPRVPLGFRLAGQTYDFNEDKRILTWSCVHEQVREPLPQGVTTFGIRHSVSSGLSGGRAFTKWSGSLSGGVVVPPNYSKRWGVVQFLGLLYDRLRRDGFVGGASLQRGGPFGLVPRLQVRRGYAFITDFAVTNEVCGKGLELSAKYWFIYPGSLLQVMAISGVTEGLPLASNSFVRWKQSLDNSTWHARGANRVEWKKTDDFIVDLCVTAPKKIELPDDPQRQRRQRPVEPQNFPGTPTRDVDHDRPTPPPPPPRQPSPPPSPRRLNIPGQLDAHKPGGPSTRGGGQTPDLLEGIVDPRLRPPPALREGFVPTEADSWTRYDLKLRYEEKKPRWAEHKPLKTEPRPLLEGIAPDVTGAHEEHSTSPGGQAGSVKERKKENVSEFQDVGTPTAKLYLSGTAERVGYRIPLPGAMRVNGAEVRLSRVLSATEEIIARVAGAPVWRRTFLIEYVLPAPLRLMPVAANPFLGISGQPGST
jgi:hypothetical protein